jgi:hypothetical protein
MGLSPRAFIVVRSAALPYPISDKRLARTFDPPAWK